MYNDNIISTHQEYFRILVINFRKSPSEFSASTLKIYGQTTTRLKGRRIYLALTTTLNDLEILALHINGQSINVDAPQDIIDVDEDDDIIDDEDVLPHGLADSDDEDLVNVDDDDGVSADVARGHGGDGGRDDHPPTHESARGCRGKGTRKPNLRGRRAGRMHTCKETQNLGLRKITDELGPQPIRFEWKDNGMMFPLGEHSAHWANLLGEITREFPMHFGSWRSIPPERKAKVLGKIRPHMQSKLWPYIKKGIDQHLGKIYTDNKSSLKRDYWVKNPDDETYDVEAIRYADAELRDSIVPVSNPDHLRYPYCGCVFLRDEDRRLYEEMVRLQGLGTYTDDQIMAMVRRDKQRGHIPGVSKVLAERGRRFSHSMRAGVAAGVARARMMIRAMMRTPARMQIVRRCYI
nr:hypothetical protein [Tanacetum cinerariifolium]